MMGKDCVVEPRLFACALEESFDGIIGISDALVELVETFVNKNIFVFFRNSKRMMRGKCEYACHKWLWHLAELGAEELKERFVPNAPFTVKLLHSAETRVGDKLVFAEISVDSGLFYECVESKRLVVSAMKKRCGVAHFFYLARKRVDVVEGVGR